MSIPLTDSDRLPIPAAPDAQRRDLLAGGVAALTLALAPVGAAQAQAGLPKPASGRIERLANFPSTLIDPRHVDVWLPEGYEEAVRAGRRFAVIYMHDGQMLFDASTTWNKQAWNVDATLSRLMRERRIPDVIVVGVWNNGKFRHSEYMPQKFLPLLKPEIRERLVREGLQGKPQSDAYLRFLVEELKPAIDARFATRTEREHTFLMGSSMGGLISVYGMSEHPQVFGGAAGLSTHWVGGFQANSHIPLAAFNYLRDHLADPATHRLYQDHGTTELDAIYAPYQRFVDEIARDRGYTQANYLSRVFEGTGHNERAWAARLEIPVLFLFGRS
ncbi:MAG TPA: alpha/beta hydrolase-fold protein [Burkholderiaceae bacterium]|nr:alpha/beta hydrolase-fold protein [Burkholderiaceae bacterium]